RAYYGETNSILKEKVNLTLAHNLHPLFCCGEPLEVREAGKQNEYVEKQLEESLFDVSEADFKNVVIAYEPIWAIGTGRTATPDQAQEMHAFIRSKIAEKYGNDSAIQTS